MFGMKERGGSSAIEIADSEMDEMVQTAMENALAAEDAVKGLPHDHSILDKQREAAITALERVNATIDEVQELISDKILLMEKLLVSADALSAQIKTIEEFRKPDPAETLDAEMSKTARKEHQKKKFATLAMQYGEGRKED